MTQVFTHEGEKFQLYLYGPMTCLCYCLQDQKLYRFTTAELMEIINGRT